MIFFNNLISLNINPGDDFAQIKSTKNEFGGLDDYDI